MANRKMICPKCGDEMNHHADKLIHSTDPEGHRRNDTSFGGFVEETYACPGCGAVAARPAEYPDKSGDLLP